MKKTVILVLCIMMLLSSNVFANTISNGSNIILENIIKEYTELYINTEEFENEAQVMNMSAEELILIKAKMAYQVRTGLLSKEGLMSVSGSLYYVDVPLIIQTKIYNC